MKAQKKKILAVDDNPNNTTIIKELFGERYDLRTAATGKKALKTALDFQPDIILLDIMLPDMDGYEVCRLLREHSSLSETKIIMVTAKGALEDKVTGYEVGANDYIAKPFEEKNILESVAFFL
ncbi:MAG: response regulator transcription factor [Phycisphaerae bacterium]